MSKVHILCAGKSFLNSLSIVKMALSRSQHSIEDEMLMLQRQFPPEELQMLTAMTKEIPEEQTQKYTNSEHNLSILASGWLLGHNSH